MDYEAAASVLQEHMRLIAECGQTIMWTKDRKAALEKLNNHTPAVNAVLGPLGLGAIGGTTLNWHRDSLGQLKHATVMLAARRKMAEASSRLGQPALPMGVLHPLVCSVARPLWDKGNYRHAIADAATVVSNHTQNRLGRHDISDRELMAQAFSDKDPEPGKPRLRCPGKPNSEVTRSMQEGAKLFAMGTFQAIRNPAHHTIGDGDPVTAFESLASLSKIARWVTEWDLERHYEPPLDLAQLTTASEALTHKTTSAT